MAMLLKSIFITLTAWICLVSARPREFYKQNVLNKTDRWTMKDKHNDIKPIGEEWEKYKVQFGKKYSVKEGAFRRNLWERNLRVIAQHNKEYKMGLHTYTMGMNEYGDLTFDEYQKYLLGVRVPPNAHSKGNLFKKDDTKSVPEEIDWHQLGYVTRVKNQGQCGSCWAFSSTGALESMHYRRTGQLLEFSEQNLVDCTLKLGNAGCGGGWMNTAFRYVRENGGIDYEQAYPYQAKTEKTCKYDPSYSGTTCAAHVDIGYGLEENLQGATATMGPVSVAIDAAHKSFQLYKSGVYYEPKCSNTSSDHAVLVVGYGKDPQAGDYWLVKNSWGTSWGLEGYIKMSRNRENNCAIASFASFPLEYY